MTEKMIHLVKVSCYGLFPLHIVLSTDDEIEEEYEESNTG